MKKKSKRTVASTAPRANGTPKPLAIQALMPPMLREHEAVVEHAIEALAPIAAIIHPDAAAMIKTQAEFVLQHLQKDGVPSHYIAPVLAQTMIDLFKYNLAISRAKRDSGETNPADPPGTSEGTRA